MKTLRQNDSGKSVEELQQILEKTGLFKEKIDGHFGDSTKSSVVQFQKNNGLAPDGIVGRQTWVTLFDKTDPPFMNVSLCEYRYIGPNVDNLERSTIIDGETAIWCARMCVGEGGKKCSEEKASAMLWAIMNRWMLMPSRHNWPTYLDLLRKFSQPINPAWQEGGDKAKEHAGEPSCTPEKFERRAAICALTWGEIPRHVRATVKSFQAGTCPPPEPLKKLERRRISNWASHAGLNEKYPWGISFSTSKRYDWFFEDEKLIDGIVVVDWWG